MKRLLQISLDTLLTSALPIWMWIILGITLKPEIANVFSLIYPLQFVYMIFTSLFAVGPNITARREKNRNVVYTNMVMGVIIVGIATILNCVNADNYISNMTMDPEIYREFYIYGICLAYLTFILQVISQKLYYEGRNKASNFNNLIFNLVNFVAIIGLTLVLDPGAAIVATLALDAIIIIFFLFKYFERRKFSFRFFKNARNVSFDLLDNLGMFLSYGIGFWNSFSFGQKYIDTINFETLSTDAQWDAVYSIDTAAKIDISEKKLKYRKSLKAAYQLILVLFATSLVMVFGLYWYYKPDLPLLAVLLLVQLIDMLCQPVLLTRWAYLQIEENKMKHNVAFFAIRIVRLLCSLLPTALCTYIGQLASAGLKLIYAKWQTRGKKVFKEKWR